MQLRNLSGGVSKSLEKWDKESLEDCNPGFLGEQSGDGNADNEVCADEFSNGGLYWKLDKWPCLLYAGKELVHTVSIL